MSIPKSLLLLPIALFAFAVQLFPLVGIVLAIALAPFWPVVLVNGAFVGVAVEAWLRDEDGPSRLWLILPIAWFGIYLGFFAADQFAVSALRAETEAANRGAPLAFDPRRHALVVERVDNSIHAMDPGALVASGQLPVVYERRHTSGREPAQTIAYRLVPPGECDRARLRRTNMIGAGIRVSREGGSCVMQAPEMPTGAIVTLGGREVQGIERGMEVRRLTLELRMPGGGTRRLVLATARPLPLIPMPVAGCILGPCEIGFWRPRAVNLAEASDAMAMVAGALGLGPARRAGTMSPEQARARLAQAEAAAMDHDLAQLERVLADTVARIDVIPFTVLRQHPARLAPLAGRIMTGLERAAELGDPARDNGRNLAGLLAILPPASLQAIGPRVLSLYRAYPAGHWVNETGDLLERIGDVGPPALPLLLSRLNRTNDRAWQPAIVGLCRIGLPAAASAGPRLLAQWRRHDGGERLEDVERALYAALLRMGLRDAAGEVTQRYEGPWYAAAWREIGPATPPERCDPRWRPPRA